LTADIVPFVYYTVLLKINKMLRLFATAYHAEIIMNKMLQKLYKNISTDGEVISKMKVAYFF